MFKDDLCSEQSGLSAVVRPSKWPVVTVISLEGGLTSLQHVLLPEASVYLLSNEKFHSYSNHIKKFKMATSFFFPNK